MNRGISGGHSVKLRCPTWAHVENFYANKVKDGVLNARVPFHPDVGSVLTIALELPDGLVVAVEGEVIEAALAPDGRKSSLRVSLYGLTEVVRSRLSELVEGERRTPAEEASSPNVQAEGHEPPAPVPLDAPVDELIEPLTVPSVSQVTDREKPVFSDLSSELEKLRAGAAHDVLGVRWDAGVEEIRDAYLGLSRRLHPDVFSRHRSVAIQLIAGELFIHVNRAYDRMRDAAVASGSAIAAGPALLPHRGWVAGFEDIQTDVGLEELPALEAPPPPPPSPSPPPPPPLNEERARAARFTPVPMTAESLFGDVTPPIEGVGGIAMDVFGADGEIRGRSAGPLIAAEMIAEARQQISASQFAVARERLADALRQDPRNRTARALYHMASAEVLLAEGRGVEATTQLEVALAHDSECEEVKALAERVDPQHMRSTPRRR